MSVKTIKINQCDVCDYNAKNPLACVATRKCEVCELDYCDDAKHTGDAYRSTSHMRSPFTSFVCANCWGLLDYNGYKNNTSPLPKGDIHLHASGSTMAINVAEFREYIEEESRQWGQKAVIEILKAIHAGRSIRTDLAAEKLKLEEKFNAKLQVIKARKYEEAVSAS